MRHAYELLIFEGHHEYVTDHEYDIVTRYRNAGGNLMFLCANNFFRRVKIHAGVMTLVGVWRELGRPEASLIGVQYYRNDNGEHRGPWIVQTTAAGVAVAAREHGARGGQHVLERRRRGRRTSSPRRRARCVVVAKIANLYGDGIDSHMTYYETPAGAKVFAAGAFSMTSAIWTQPVQTLMTNLWERLSKD